MKKLFIVLAITAGVFASNQSKSQAVEQGKMLIDVYYGFPNLWTSVLKSAYADSPTAAGIKIGTLGPIGGRFEYLLSDKIGLGIDVQTASSSVSWTDSTYNYKVSANRLRFCPRINVHFGSNDKLDFYGAFGIGYKTSNLKFTSNDPGFNEASGSISLTPITWRMAIGIRYFFTDNIGAGLEMGFGGVLATAGLAVKF